MVFRKPYAFLIKNFKLIHIILTILIFLFFLKMRSITGFLDQYIAMGTYQQASDIIGQYIGVWAFFLPILIIIISAIVMALLKMKNKPIKFYLLTILGYFIQIIIVSVALVLFSDIQQGEVSATFTQIFRDLIGTISYFNIPFLIMTLVRGSGFNIKQFNFKKDLIELDINEEDSEEFEVEVEVDTEDIKAKLNRRFRFAKYIYLENKPIFWGIGAVILLSIVIGIFVYISSIEKIYNEKEVFNAYNLNLKVDNSYITNEAIDGSKMRDDKFYVIVSLEAENPYQQDLNIPYKNIYVRVSDYKKYAPIDSYRDEFSDFGLRFISTDKIKALEKRQIVLVYEIDSEYRNNKLRLEYLAKESPEGKDLIYDYVKVKLKPKEFTEKKLISTKKIGEKLTFDDSLIYGTELQIDEIEFNNKYSYSYKQVIGSKEYEFTKAIIPTDTLAYSKIVLRLKTTLKKSELLNQKIYSSLYEKFVTIEYEKDGKMLIQPVKVIDLTPTNGEYAYLEVLSEVAESNKVNLIFTIRDKQYRYVIVDKE